MWPVFVINMADNSARMDKCAAQLSAQGIEFERFEAVNGRALSDIEAAKVYDAAENARVFRHPLLRGELGCYLSHIGIWQRIAEGEATGAVVLEDDFSADDGLAEVLRALGDSAEPWDMVKLYTRRLDKRMLRPQPLVAGRELVTPYAIPNTTLGYVIRKDAAARLLARATPFARPIDEDHKRFWEHGLDVRLVLPPVLGLNDEAFAANSIEADRKSQSGTALLRQGWKNLSYRLAYLAQLIWHRNLGR
jgi:glycosyl transferase, family 25